MARLILLFHYPLCRYTNFKTFCQQSWGQTYTISTFPSTLLAAQVILATAKSLEKKLPRVEVSASQCQYSLGSTSVP